MPEQLGLVANSRQRTAKSKAEIAGAGPETSVDSVIRTIDDRVKILIGQYYQSLPVVRVDGDPFARKLRYMVVSHPDGWETADIRITVKVDAAQRTSAAIKMSDRIAQGSEQFARAVQALIHGTVTLNGARIK